MTQNSNGVIILITLLNILVYKLQQLQEAKFTQQTNQLSLSLQKLCRRFSLRDIQWATFNFHDELVIGQGGFGKVYKGILDFGATTVAIKRLKSGSKQGPKEFLTEIEMLSNFQHSHLVSLVGYCDDCHEMILIYEYMPCATLADHLHKRARKGVTSSPPLSWEQRLKICIGAARGLDYLHTGTSVQHRVIHRDVKSSNILLDENMAAKISDFGLSKIGPSNQPFSTYVSTHVKGTPGYLDPYYFATHTLTRKSDVYGLGVVLFEALCGRRAVDNSLDEEQRGLAGWAQHCFKEGLLDQIIDPSTKGKILPNSLEAFVRVAIQCLHNAPKHRPTMAEVVVGLESALALQERGTIYTLVETPITNCDQVNVNAKSSKLEEQIMKYNQEYVDSSMVGGNPMVEVENANHNQENKKCSLEEGVINDADGGHHDEQSPARMTFTEKIGLFLFGKARMFSERAELPWSVRLKVLIGAGRRLAFFHEAEEQVILRSFKTSDILLDGEFNAKLSDLGLAKIGPVNSDTHVSTRVMGTYGYAAPEYVAVGHSDAKPSRNRRSNDNMIMAPNLKMFTLAELRKATRHFRPDMRLGKGGFGRVYEGWVHEKTYAPSEFGVGMAIAVKSMQLFEEWQTEIEFLGNCSHRNLVKLLGYCQEDKELLLVYEYMQNGSLDNHLNNSVKSSYLDWERRYKIIGGVARGLLYLHEDSRLRIIHRDVKVSNVLLDAEMNPKIAGVGMARLFDLDETRGNTRRVVGTYGYMAPEYAIHGEFSVKSDVFSFGVLVLEIISGQKNSSFLNENEEGNEEGLVSYAWKNWRAGAASNVIDPTLIRSSSGSLGEMMRCIHIGLLCVQENAADRPTMASVAHMVDSVSLTLALPSEPAFFMQSSIDPEKEESANFSLNEDSLTDLYPR